MNIYGITRENLEKYFVDQGEKKFKASQIFEWLYQHRVKKFEDMTNIKKDLQDKLKQDFSMDMITIQKKQVDKLTSKYLFKLYDGNFIEAVLMQHDYGLSVCISSEVGCNMGCKFCESGRLKKVRNLEAHEMVEQILIIEEDIQKRISSVVIMGIGEPLDNYDNVMSFIRIINDSKGIQIGARHITLSTCGIIPKIKELMNENIQINLAVSLHAPNSSLRNKIMPINKAYDIKEFIKTIREYISKTTRRVTIEYVMLDGINDNESQAKELIGLFKGMNIYINLIPYNETENIGFKKSNKETIMKFYDILKKGGINVTIRKEFGSNIDAACGQLRSKER
jgi:23S rRNA (adenine2503-C2)-methyltransferase